MNEAATTPESRPPCPLWATIIATGFGIGYIPYAPGTFGSLASIGILYLVRLWMSCPLPPTFMRISMFILPRDPAWMAMILVGLFTVLGVPAATKFAAASGVLDPKQVVIDEYAGQMLVFAIASFGMERYSAGGFLCFPFVVWIAAFALFRFFDILKPWPINRLEHLPRGWGVMADDLCAGAAAGLILFACVKLPWQYLPFLEKCYQIM